VPPHGIQGTVKLGKWYLTCIRNTVDSAISKLGPPPSKKGQGLVGDIEELGEAIRRYPWTTLTALKGDPHVLAKLEETEKLLKDLRKTLSR
jgi:hypothetical protein